jgi:S-adenosylmethionine:tRNA ribosyltransferase-isomerase
VLVSDFDFHLPEELIAQRPPSDRAAARMLHLQRESGVFSDEIFRDFPTYLRPGDLLVMNNTRVIPARLFGHRSGHRAQTLSPENPAMKDFLQGRCELLLTKQMERPFEWEGLVRPGRKIGVGERLTFGEGDGQLVAEVIGRGEFGERTVRFDAVPNFMARLERLGHMPLPPYIERVDEASDREMYQTIYAQKPGSVAAPTAGLHFTPEVLGQIREGGVETAEVTLHVGLGTFQPVRVEEVEKVKLHTERYEITPDAAAKIAKARLEGRRVVAVGTTTVRTLEFAASQSPSGEIPPQSGEADIFIHPGFRFEIVGALLTNFHLPKSTLLMLVSAFAGREHVLRAYEHAVQARYKFFSYGDCMFIE